MLLPENVFGQQKEKRVPHPLNVVILNGFRGGGGGDLYLPLTPGQRPTLGSCCSFERELVACV